MKTLTVKNVPDELYAQLGHVAKANQRSLNRQVIVQLESSLKGDGFVDAENELVELGKFRESLGFRTKSADITKAKREGRP